MFELTDGREYLWQWDLDRQVKVSDPTVTEVHFCNGTSDCSLVTEVKDGLANIPNILLQQAYNIRVFAYCGCYTRVESTIKVRERTRPSDYAYTETEVRTWNEFNERLSLIEDNTYIYCFEVPDVLETGTATEEMISFAQRFIDNQNVAVWFVNSGGYHYECDQIKVDGNRVRCIYFPMNPSNISAGATLVYKTFQIDLDTNKYVWGSDMNVSFATKSYVDKAIAEVETAGGVSQEYVDNAISNIDIPTVPTNVSGFTNDAGYITIEDVPETDLTGYATEDYVTTAITNALNGIATAEEGSY